MHSGSMEESQTPVFRVSDFLAIVNQSLDMAFGAVEIEGEVSSFKINHQKFIFFDLKDNEGSVSCFMTVWQLRTPIEDGMKVVVRAAPKVTQWGKFSLTVSEIRPLGAGSIKKSQDLLRQKLDKEGLFDGKRKRQLPDIPENIAVISSTGAAGYADFMKIASERFGGINFRVANVQVQGIDAPAQIVRAIEYFNQQPDLPEVIVIVRGGGSKDDLAAFNDEPLVRAIVASRIPILTGIGHETDESLSDLAADVTAVTPTNAAQILLPDRQDIIEDMSRSLGRAKDAIVDEIEVLHRKIDDLMSNGMDFTSSSIESLINRLDHLRDLLISRNPQLILERGYALVRGEIKIGSDLIVETRDNKIRAEIKEIYERRQDN